MTTLHDDLTALEAQLRWVSILGATPLGATADAVARIGASLEGLDARISVVSVALAANSDALAANANSLARLGDSAEAMSARLGSGWSRTRSATCRWSWS